LQGQNGNRNVQSVHTASQHAGDDNEEIDQFANDLKAYLQQEDALANQWSYEKQIELENQLID